MKPPNFAPLYAALYPELAEVARSHGYALAVHGSLARDFDLIAVPWAESVSEPGAVVAELVRDFALTLTADATEKPHGRRCYTLSVGFGECFLDLSFTPSAP